MNEDFINSVPESDPGYAVKRLEIQEWYGQFGKKILMDADLSYVAEKFNNFSDAKYWMHRQSGDFILNRVTVSNELLGMKRTDDKYLLNDYQRYEVACWLCSEEDVRKIFTHLEKDTDWSKEHVTDILSRYCTLMAFWSHYVNIIDENGEYVINPSTKILNNLKELIADYNEDYDENLDYFNQVDLWKYGFECANEEGCIEALEFFLNKLEGRITQDERDEVLINTALHVTSSGNFFSLMHSRANVIDFCLAHLGADKYEMFLKANLEVDGCYSIIDELLYEYLFGYAKELIDCLGPEDISPERYSIFICDVAGQIGDACSKGLMQMGSDFLIWIWNKEKFAKHKKFYLDELNNGDPISIRVLPNLAVVGAFQPLEEILDAANKTERKKIAKLFYRAKRPCCALYIQGRKDLLDKVLDDAEYSDNFIKAIEEILKENPANKQKWDCACNLHKEFKIVESMTKILELLSDYGLYDIEKRIKKFALAGGDVPSSLV